MKLQACKCNSCGAPLKMSTMQASVVFCEYCGTSYIVNLPQNKKVENEAYDEMVLNCLNVGRSVSTILKAVPALLTPQKTVAVLMRLEKERKIRKFKYQGVIYYERI